MNQNPAPAPYALRTTPTDRRALAETWPRDRGDGSIRVHHRSSTATAAPCRKAAAAAPGRPIRCTARNLPSIYRIDDKTRVVTVVDICHRSGPLPHLRIACVAPANESLGAIITPRGAVAAHRRSGRLDRGHVDEAAVMALERDRHCSGRAVAVLGHDQVRLACSRRLPFVGILAMQQDHYVTILLY